MRHLQEHWRDLRAHPHVFAIVARNAVPVLGVLTLGWSADLVVFNYWFDGLTAVAAIASVLIPHLLRTVEAEESIRLSAAGRAVVFVLAWAIGFGLMATPYWMVLIPLGDLLASSALWGRILSEPLTALALLAVAGFNVAGARGRNYDAPDVRVSKQAVRWDLYLLVLRALAMFLLAMPFIPLLTVVGMALVLCYLELFPARALHAFYGDPKRLWTLQPPKPNERRHR